MIKNYRLTLLIVLLFSLVLRCLQLDQQSLWLDELYTMKMVDPAHGLKEIYQLSLTVDPLSVLYFIIVNTWVKVFGYTAVSVRSVSAIFGVLGIFCIYILGKQMKDRWTGMAAAILLAVNYYHIAYSQEARVYTMYCTCTCISFYFLIKFLGKPGYRSATYYGLGALLMVLCHFFGIFTLIGQLIILLTQLIRTEKKDRRNFCYYLILSAAIFMVGYIPIIPIFIWLLGNEGTWISPITADVFANTYAEFFGHSTYLVVFSGLLILSCFFFFLKNISANRDSGNNRKVPVLYILLIWIVVTFMIPYIQSKLAFPTLNTRYVINILPAIIIMMALGVTAIPKNSIRVALLGAFVILSLVDLFAWSKYYKRDRKSDFKTIAKYVTENNVNESVIITSLPFHFDYYFKIFNNSAPVSDIPVDAKLSQMRTGKEAPAAFWVAEAHGRNLEISDSNQRYLEMNFDQLKSIEKYEAWAKFYVPKLPQSIDLVLNLHAADFNDSIGALKKSELYLFNNSKIRSREINLESGKYRMVIKAQSLPARAISGNHAHLNVWLNEEPVASYFLNRTSFISGDTFLLNVTGKGNAIALEFDNDTCVGQLDRNVLLGDIQFLKTTN
jgi:4-amino-4-deoxy-L-arabinose transferase-like glycosyltransferase